MEPLHNALPPEGPAKPAQNSSPAYSASPRERVLLILTFAVCLLTVNTILATGAGAGWFAAAAAWYVLLWASQGPGLLRTGESRFLLPICLALPLLSMALGSSGPFRVWNLLALLVLLPVHAAGLSGAAQLPWYRPAMVWERFCLLLWGLFGHLGAAGAALSPGKSGGRRLVPLVLGGLGAALLLAVLVPVLASADALFAAATADLRSFVSLRLTDAAVRAFAAAVMTPFLFGLLYSLRHGAPLGRALRPGRSVDALAPVLMLAALDLLYLLFLGVQSAGLFGGPAYLAERGISYAAWARSGFFQMVGVTAVNLTVLLAALSRARREGRSWTALRLLAAALVAESLVLLASAAWRMTLYVSAYGLSFKRFLTYWGMGMMALFFLAAARKIRRLDSSFCRLAFPLALAGWLAVNCVPVDLLVAKNQVDRYLSGQSPSIDVEYLLYSLSYDALSQLDRLDGAMICRNWSTGGQARLDTLIQQRRDQAREDCGDWRTWSLSAHLAAEGGG